MPKIIVTVPETIQSVVRPVVLDVARQLFAATGISEDTQIFYPGDNEKTYQPGTSISDEGSGINNFPFYERVSIEVDEEYDVDRMLAEAVYRPENYMVFRDDALNIYLRPVYSSTATTINFKYRALDKTQAERWRDDIRTRVAILREQRLHEITYHYPLPIEMLYILREIHRLRELTAGYDDSYDDYLKKHLTPYATEVVTMEGTEKAWAIAETQIRIVGYFDFEATPEKGAKDSEGGEAWTVSFSYKFKYDKPVACSLSYPLMIHNSVLSEKFRPEKPAYELDQYERYYSMSTQFLHGFEKGTIKFNAVPGVSLPNFDEFIPGAIVPDTVRVFTTMIQLDKENPNFLFSLKDLGDIAFEPSVLQFLVGEAPYMTQMYQSIFQITLYRGIKMMEPSFLIVDSNLDVYSAQTLNFREYHHVRVSLVTNLNLLPWAAKNRLRQDGCLCRRILEAIDRSLVIKKKLPISIAGQCTPVTRDSLQKAADAINASAALPPVIGATPILGRSTEILFIQSFRSDNANR